MGSGQRTILSWVLSFIAGIVVGWIAVVIAYLVVGLLMTLIAPGKTKVRHGSDWWDVLGTIIAFFLAYSSSDAFRCFGTNSIVVSLTAYITILIIIAKSSEKDKKKECGTLTTQSLPGSNQEVRVARS